MRTEYAARPGSPRPTWPPTGWPSSRRWFADAVRGRPARAERDGPGHRRRRRPAQRPDRAAQGVDERGFVFFTNYTSRKGTELAANPYASLVFPLVPDRPPGRRRGRGRAGRPGRDRGVLRHPAARRRSSAPGPARSRRWCRTGRTWTQRLARVEQGSAGRAEPRRRRTGAGCGCAPDDGGVLAGPHRPAARPPPVPARPDGPDRLGRGAAGSVTTTSANPARDFLRRHASTPGRCGHPPYRRMFIGNAVSIFGFQFTAVAVPVQMYALTRLVGLGRPARAGRPGAAGRLRPLGRRDRRRRRPAPAAARSLAADVARHPGPAGAGGAGPAQAGAAARCSSRCRRRRSRSARRPATRSFRGWCRRARSRRRTR